MNLRQRTVFALIIVMTFALACSDDDGFLGPVPKNGADLGSDLAATDQGGDPPDASAGLDASADVSTPDANSEGEDTGIDVGVDAAVDAGTDSGSIDMESVDAGEDTGVDQGASPCDGLAIGQTCSGEDCPSPYSCVEGRCVPVPGAERPDCGGFVGATCTTRTFPTCTYFTGADYGPCLTTAEEMCACTEHTDLFQCFGL